MRILISGASGLIGEALSDRLNGDGRQVVRLVRDRCQLGETAILWDPDSGILESRDLQGIDAVIHLAGENIAAGRWTPARKARIMESRERGTRLLAETAAQLDPKPRVFVSASAVGFYGDRGDEILTEESAPGQGFVAEVCRNWERSTQPASAAGIRVVRLRFGIVLSPNGGALKKMIPPFRWGLGGPIAGGRQWMSWISLDDAVSAVVHAIDCPDLIGAVNVVSPEPARNARFTKALAQALRRPAFFPIPGIALKALFGEMGEATALASARALPVRLEASGFTFQQPNLQKALLTLLSRSS